MVTLHVDHTHNINYTTSRYIVGEGGDRERINAPPMEY